MRIACPAYLLVVLVPVLAGCASAQTSRGAVPELVAQDTVPGAEPERSAVVSPPAPRPWPGSRISYHVEVELASADGSPLAAPRLTVFENQAASVAVATRTAFVQTFEVERTRGAWVADPIIGQLSEGLTVECVVRGVAGDSGAVDIAYRIVHSDVLEPMPLRDVGFLPGDAGGTIQLPKIVTSDALGAVRLRAGETRTVAMGWPSHDGRVSISARPAAYVSDAGELPDFTAGETAADLRRLLDVLADRRGQADQVEVRAWSTPRDLFTGTPWHDGLIRSQRQFGALQLVDLPGARAAVTVTESYVGDYEPGRVSDGADAERDDVPAAYQPVVRTLESGLATRVASDGRLDVTWTTAPPWTPYTTQLANRRIVSIDMPQVRVHGARCDLGAPRSLVPVARLSGGGALVVSVFHDLQRPSE